MQERIWLKRVLAVPWVLQIIICGLFAVTAILSLMIVDQEDGTYTGALENAVQASAGVQLTFSALTLLFDLAEIIAVCTQRLTPLVNIVLQTIKSLIWTGFFILAIVAVAQHKMNFASIFLVLVLFLTCKVQLIYGAVIMHRHRKGTLYNRGNERYRHNYANAGNYGAPHQDPFRDPSRTTLPYDHQDQADLKPTGAAQEHYGSHRTQSYEMHER